MNAVFGPPGVIEYNHMIGGTPNDDICIDQTEIFLVALVCVFPHLSFDDLGVICAVSDTVGSLFIDAVAFRVPKDGEIVVCEPDLHETGRINAQGYVAIKPN